MTINSGNRFWQNVTKDPFAEVEMAPETRALLQEAMYGVASELVVRSGHSTQSHSETIEEVKRILLDHLGKH